MNRANVPQLTNGLMLLMNCKVVTAGMAWSQQARLTQSGIAKTGQQEVLNVEGAAGLDVHEGPWITRGNEAPLEPGMVFTIEPGLYMANVLGVRVEDNVVITDDGLESLTSFPRELRIIG